jgi:GNAT superfamily N-acetyltransferase
MSERASAPRVDVRRESVQSDVAAALIATLNAELTELYPEPGATHFRLDPAEVAAGHGAFLVAYADGRPVGCGAVRRLDPETAELKRMYVELSLRGCGIGRALLEGLEREARALGVRRVVLETGIRQKAAIALYSRTGYEATEPYGEYVLSSATSVCMGKIIA